MSSTRAESYIMEEQESRLTGVTEMSAETLSVEIDSLGYVSRGDQSVPRSLRTSSSTAVLCSPNSRKGSIISAVKHTFRSIATSMVPVGPDGPDEKPLSPRDIETASSSSTPPPAASVPLRSKKHAKEDLPRPPFSCLPVYIFILAVIFLIIVMGGVNALLELKPDFLYGRRNETADWTNSTLVL